MKVSVVIPVYNQAEFIGEAIESALRQTHPPHQVIVVNDGSTDATDEVCSRYVPRIEYIVQENAGPSAARNAALRSVTGEAVLFLDSDDVLDENWLTRAAEAYRESSTPGHRVGVVYSDYLLFDDAGLYEKEVSVRSVTVQGLLRDSLLIPSGTFVTRACLDDVGAFNSYLDTCEDWDYWLRAALRGYEFVRAPVIGFRHREHSASASKREISALHARVRFLDHWLQNGVLDPARRGVVEQELVRTLLRLRRAAYLRGEPTDPYLQRALQLDPGAVMDPWLFVFGAVYAGPFFRTQVSSDQTRASIEEMRAEVVRYLGRSGAVPRRLLRRLRASAALASAADQVVVGRRARAGVQVLRALLADPTLVLDPIRRRPRYTAEFARVSGSL